MTGESVRLFSLAAVAVLAAMLNVSFTFGAIESGIRISVADVVLPIALLLAMLWTFNNGYPRSALLLPSLPIWILAISLWFGISLWRAASFAPLESWAVFNKFGGWFVLVSYGVCGIWAAAMDADRKIVLRAFVGTSWLIAAGTLMLMAVYAADIWRPAWFLSQSSRPTGLTENPNAFAFLLIVTFAVQAPFMRARELFSHRWLLLGAACGWALIFLTGSRGAWLAAFSTLLALAFLRALDHKTTLFSLVAAAVLCVVILYGGPLLAGLLEYKTDYASYANTSAVGRLGNFSISQRADLNAAVIELWRASPVFGIGLGSVLAAQKTGMISFAEAFSPQVIHITALWLLVETGIVGLVLFVTFAAFALRAIWIARSSNQLGVYGSSALALFVAAAAMSLSSEILYQRHLWFLMGLAMAHFVKRPAGGQ